MVPMDSNIGETRVWRLDSGIQDTSTASTGLSGFDLQPDPTGGAMISRRKIQSMGLLPREFSTSNFLTGINIFV